MLRFSRPRLVSPVCRQCVRRLTSDSKVFAEGDTVLLRLKKRADHEGFIIKKLKRGTRIENQHGVILHDYIIGRRVRDVFNAAGVKQTEYRIHEPTLDEYIRLVPRIVTPIYPNDANIIVGLLDIHVEPPTDRNASTPPIEILEAGTGHGSLTLHLARAIAGANPPPPTLLEPVPTDEEAPHPLEDATYDGSTTHHMAEQTIESWKRKRRAIVHTLDVSEKHSRHAAKVINGFRYGLYTPHIDMHVGDVSDFVRGQLAARAKSAKPASSTTSTPSSSSSSKAATSPFLSHVFLDLASAEEHLDALAPAMRTDAILAVFNPSITQIADASRVIKARHLPFALERVVELKGSDTVRNWDVRLTKLRKAGVPAEAAQAATPVPEDADAEDGDALSALEGAETPEPVPTTSSADSPTVAQAKAVEQDVARRDAELVDAADDPADWKMVCRPKAGVTFGVGGFVGIFRRKGES
ncbi:uncharacterized protein K452DRAFT_318326 [Aplosporella prunicola CBS 121167]|uniref:tRNA (adenine(58)-N(1))-methyltransferase catalytic subunit TRM61 n=1 Tax=Aplosporella prunicola CBS 121167 TaxID=1176127 RepID=A0A6A6BCR4_9PEZI|nr:uncharacterized protein K452DRAFT_318326 [Aplosporella prunicola CBS 121167]KAF2141992.1 hypothetical protein K452DRAFT_318326 [Aplosporella prunicola CBS 121167]